MKKNTGRRAVPKLKKFIDRMGRGYVNVIAAKMVVSEMTIRRWLKDTTRPSPAEREKLLKIIRGYNEKGKE